MNTNLEAPTSPHARNRWWALVTLSLGSLMIALDETIVIAALPQIAADLKFTKASVVWIVNAYLLSFGGFLLLGGRMGDLFGHRRVFMGGIVLFTLASLGCGLSEWQGMLVCARAMQGLGGALVSAVAVSLAINIFRQSNERARAMSTFGFVSAGGGSLSLLLGGALTTSLTWHWIFFVNVPIGALVCMFAAALIPKDEIRVSSASVDVTSAVIVTTAVIVALYAIMRSGEPDGSRMELVGLLSIAVSLLSIFLMVEGRTAKPLLPLALFRLGNLATSNVLSILLAAAILTWYCFSALYLQLVLRYSPLQVGLAFFPSNQIMAVATLWLSPWLVIRLGAKTPIAIGLLLSTIGSALFAAAPVNGRYQIDVLPGMLLISLGVGIASTPLLLSAMTDVNPRDTGIASGVLGTVSNMGAALGLAVLFGVAAARTGALRASGVTELAALNSGYHFVFLTCSALMAAAAFIGVAFLRFPRKQTLGVA